MIKLEKATAKDTNFVSSFNLKNIDNVYLIKNNLDCIGIIEYTTEKDEDDEYASVYVEYIDILKEYRRKGFASRVIEILSNEGNNYIYGNSLPSQTSVLFWKSLGADFEGEDDFLDEYIENNECLAFSI